jgi:kumamolisin
MVVARTVSTAYPRTDNPKSMPVLAAAGAYGFPLTKATGKGYVGGIIELGGGYDLGQLAVYFASINRPMPTFTFVPVGSGSNTPDNDGADGEVQSDMIMAGVVAPGAELRIYGAGNTDEEFLAATTQALNECHGVALSWGGPESQWNPQVMLDFESVIAAAKTKGVPFFVAAGDSGADDGTGSPTVDFPASAPSSIAVGGTRLILNPDGTRASETLWNDNPANDATGGGVSLRFPGRTVPDIAGNADPDTGYQVSVDGTDQVIGGTSLPTPMFLGLHALLWELAGGKPPDFLGLVTTHATAYFDAALGTDTDMSAVLGDFRVPNGAVLAMLVTPEPAPPPAPTPVGQPIPPQHLWTELIIDLEALIAKVEALLTTYEQHASAGAQQLVPPEATLQSSLNTLNVLNFKLKAQS